MVFRVRLTRSCCLALGGPLESTQLHEPSQTSRRLVSMRMSDATAVEILLRDLEAGGLEASSTLSAHAQAFLTMHSAPFCSKTRGSKLH